MTFVVVCALVLVPGIGASLAFAAPGAISIETRIALAFGLGYAVVAGVATFLALVHALEQPVFVAAVILVTVAVWIVAVRRASPREHATAFRSQAREAPFALTAGLMLLATVAVTRPLWPAESSLSIRASWRYWADGLEVAAAGHIPAQSQQWGTEIPATVSKGVLNSFGGGISLLLGPDPLPAMQAIMVVTAVGLAAALLALGRELGLRTFAPLVPTIVVFAPERLPLSQEFGNNLRNYTAEGLGRMVAFSAVLTGIYAVRERSRAAAVITGLVLALGGLTHLIPTLVAGAILLFYSVAVVLNDRGLLKSALLGGAIMTTVFGVSYVSVIGASGGDLGFQRAAGASELSLPDEIDPTQSLARGELVPKEKEGRFLISPGSLLRRYGEETVDRPLAARYTVLGLAALVLAAIVMVVALRAFLPLATIALGLCFTMLAVGLIFSYRYDTVVPGDWGARRLYNYAGLVPGLLVPGLFEALTRPLTLRSRAASAGLALLVGLVAVVAVIVRIPDRSLPRAEAGLAVIDRVAETVPCDARMLANARTAGTWQATTGRRAVTEGHAVFLRPKVLERILPVLIGANEFFSDPAANRSFLHEQRIEYLVVVEPGVWSGVSRTGRHGPHSLTHSGFTARASTARRISKLRDEGGHLDRGRRRLPALVGGSFARPLERFLDRVGREHAKGHRHTGRAGGIGEPVRHGGRDVLEVRGRAANEATQADDGLESSRRGRAPRRERDLEGAGHLQHGHVIRRHTGARQGRQRAGLQPVGDEVVILRHDDRDAECSHLLHWRWGLTPSAFLRLMHSRLCFPRRHGRRRTLTCP